MKTKHLKSLILTGTFKGKPRNRRQGSREPFDFDPSGMPPHEGPGSEEGRKNQIGEGRPSKGRKTDTLKGKPRDRKQGSRESVDFDLSGMPPREGSGFEKGGKKQIGEGRPSKGGKTGIKGKPRN